MCTEATSPWFRPGILTPSRVRAGWCEAATSGWRRGCVVAERRPGVAAWARLPVARSPPPSARRWPALQNHRRPKAASLSLEEGIRLHSAMKECRGLPLDHRRIPYKFAKKNILLNSSNLISRLIRPRYCNLPTDNTKFIAELR